MGSGEGENGGKRRRIGGGPGTVARGGRVKFCPLEWKEGRSTGWAHSCVSQQEKKEKRGGRFDPFFCPLVTHFRKKGGKRMSRL